MLWVGELPVDAANAGGDRAHLLAASRDSEVGPVERVHVELAGDVIGGVDSDLPKRLDHLRVGRGAGFAAGGASLVAVIGCLTEQSLGHHAAAAVGDADEQNVHAASFSA